MTAGAAYQQPLPKSPLRIVLLPGLDGTGKFCTPLAQALETSWDVQVVHYPAHLSRYSDLLPWLRAKLVGENFALVAESFSGPLALQLSASQPQGLKALVLVASFARPPRLVPASFASLLRGLPLGSKAIAFLAKRFLIGPFKDNRFLTDFSLALRSVPNKVLVGRLGETLRVNELATLTQIAVPKLAVVAAQDWLVASRRTQDFRKAGWRVETVEGPHFLTFANPKGSARAIEDFLRQLPETC